MAKLVALDVEETSGVDFPAHLDNGWIVMKASDKETSVNQPYEEEQVAASDEEKAATPEETIAQLEAKVAELHSKIDELTAEHEAMPEVEASVDDLAKAAPEPLAKAFQELQERVAKAETTLKAKADEEQVAAAGTFVKSLDRLNLGDDAAAILRTARNEAPELAKAVEAMLTTVNGQVESAGLFDELGKATAPAPTGGASAQLDALAKARANSENITVAKAYAGVLDTPAGRDLYKQHLTEAKG